VGAHDRHTEHTIPARRGEHLHHAFVLAVGDGPVEVVQPVAGDFIGDALGPRLLLVEADGLYINI